MIKIARKNAGLWAWRNDGSRLPYRMRGWLRYASAGSRTVILDCPRTPIPPGFWLIVEQRTGFTWVVPNSVFKKAFVVV